MGIISKIMPMMLIAIMSVNISGCGNSTVANGSQPASTVVSSSEVVYKTIEPPADGWTDDLIYQVSYFCGQPLKLPCKFDDLKLYDELSWDEPHMQEMESVYVYNGKEYSDIYNIDFTYHDIYIGSCGYILDNNQKIVIYIQSHRVPEYHIEKNKLDQNTVDKLNKVIVVNDVYNGNSEKELISLLGDNYTKHGTYYNLVYSSDTSEIVFMIPDSEAFTDIKNNKVEKITIEYNYGLFSDSQ